MNDLRHTLESTMTHSLSPQRWNIKLQCGFHLGWRTMDQLFVLYLKVCGNLNLNLWTWKRHLIVLNIECLAHCYEPFGPCTTIAGAPVLHKIDSIPVSVVLHHWGSKSLILFLIFMGSFTA